DQRGDPRARALAPGLGARDRAGAHRGEHPLQGGSRRRLARPRDPRNGARGQLRRAHPRRGGGADRLGRPGGRLHPRPRSPGHAL
ncbi:MAG: Acyl carrier protein, partial [uncultured Solirubrobacterales bacterium]